MPTIQGRVVNSGNVVINGFVRVKFDAPLIDTSTTPDTIFSVAPATFAITSGSVSFTLPATAAQNVSVTFETIATTSVDQYFLQNGNLYDGPRFQHSDNNWYTGQAITMDNSQTPKMINQLLTRRTGTTEAPILPPFSTYIPDVPTIEYWSLITSGITTPSIALGSWGVAELLVSSAFKDRLPKGVEWMGVYNVATSYTRNQVVSRSGDLYIWDSASTFAGRDPLVAANVSPSVGSVWSLFLPKGTPGGTGASIVGYSAAAWQGSAEAAARGDVKSALDGLAPPDLSNYVTTSALNTAVSPLASKTLLSSSILGLMSCAVFEERQATNVAGGASAAGANRRNLNNSVQLQSWATRSGRTITLQAGTYCFLGEAVANAVDAHRVFVVTVSDTVGTAIARIVQGRSETSAGKDILIPNSPNIWGMCGFSVPITFAAATMVELWHWVRTAQPDDGLGVATNENGQPEIYARLTIWKVG